MMNRRSFFTYSTTAIITAFLPLKVLAKEQELFKIMRTKREWKDLLSNLEYKVMRKHGTERAFSSPLDKVFDEGIYHCKGCDLALYSSIHKFNSGTGWPSFTEPITDSAVKYEKDVSFGMIRVEAMCNTCDAHLGHVFPDGPEPSGLRFCINSESLTLDKK